MSIKLRCEKCGANITAPREMAGRMGKCPSCQNEMYIATPEEEIEELPFAAEEPTSWQQDAQRQAEQRRLDSLLAQAERGERDSDASDSGGSAGRAAAGYGTAGGGYAGDAAGVGSSNRVEQMLRKYFAAVRDSDLDGADRALNVLKLQPRTARELIDRLIMDQIPPAEAAHMAPAAYLSMLKTLRGKL